MSTWLPIGITAAAAITGWCSVIVRLLWQFRGRWDQTNSALEQMARQIADLADRDNRIEQKLEHHLEWHQRFRRPSGRW